MAQAITLVCDVCGRPEAKTVTIRVNSRNLQKDFCSRHLAELIQGARTPKRGRRPGSSSKSSSASKPAARKTVARKTVARKTKARKRVAAKA